MFITCMNSYATSEILNLSQKNGSMKNTSAYQYDNVKLRAQSVKHLQNKPGNNNNNNKTIEKEGETQLDPSLPNKEIP